MVGWKGFLKADQMAVPMADEKAVMMVASSDPQKAEKRAVWRVNLLVGLMVAE